jgi:hypothetical protein
MSANALLKKELASHLVAEAIARHGANISKCCGKLSFSDSMTEWRGTIQLWYNDAAGSTHIVKLEGVQS